MKIGIFGGTFDPPHVGHLILAGEAADQLHLDKVLWVVTPNPPHKRTQPISQADQRSRLVQAAIAGDARFEMSRVDLDRPAPHYSIDTVRILAEENADAKIYFLIGGDSLRDLPTWHQPEVLTRLVDGFGVLRRPGAEFDLSDLEKRVPGVIHKIIFIDTPQIDISARVIRERIQNRRHYRHFLPPGVFALIEEHGWYKK